MSTQSSTDTVREPVERVEVLVGQDEVLEATPKARLGLLGSLVRVVAHWLELKRGRQVTLKEALEKLHQTGEASDEGAAATKNGMGRTSSARMTIRNVASER